MFTLRPYQQEAADKAVAFLTGQSGQNGIEVLPTGAGKSLVIADVVHRLPGPAIVFQPSREILEQNEAKLQSYGYSPSVYSASAGRKEDSGEITLATIGSVVNKPELF